MPKPRTCAREGCTNLVGVGKIDYVLGRRPVYNATGGIKGHVDDPVVCGTCGADLRQMEAAALMRTRAAFLGGAFVDDGTKKARQPCPHCARVVGWHGTRAAPEHPYPHHDNSGAWCKGGRVV